jgi:hypothetical protein
MVRGGTKRKDNAETQRSLRLAENLVDIGWAAVHAGIIDA